MGKEGIIGELEIRVGTARKNNTSRTRAVNLLFGGKSEKEWLATQDPINVQHISTYTDWIEGTEDLELWQFLLAAAQDWEPGDNVIPVSHKESTAYPEG